MKSKFCSALATMMLIASLVATPAMAEKKAKSVSARAMASIAIKGENSTKQKMIDVFDPRPAGTDLANQFPLEFKKLTVLTMNLTFQDFFGDEVRNPRQPGMNIQEILVKMDENWKRFEGVCKAFAKAHAPLVLLPVTDIDRVTISISKLIVEADSNTTIGEYPWRKLYTYSKPSADFENLYKEFEQLHSPNTVNCQLPFLEFAARYGTTPPTAGTEYGPVSKVLSEFWLKAAGGFTYYDLFTLSSEDVSPAQADAIEAAIGYGILRNSPYGTMATSSPLADNCCCQNLNQYGKKTCSAAVALGCTSTGTGINVRCTLGSIACPAGTACP